MCTIRTNLARTGSSTGALQSSYNKYMLYHVYKDQWASFLEENLQPIVNAAIPTIVCAISCYE